MQDFPFGRYPPSVAGDPRSMTREHVDKFVSEGYCVLRGFFSADEVKEKKAAAADLLARCSEPGFAQLCRADSVVGVEGQDQTWGGVTVGTDPWAAGPSDASNPGRVTYVNDVHAVDATMELHMRNRRLLVDVLSPLLGDEIDGYQQAFVVKPPCSNIEYHGWHQDV